MSDNKQTTKWLLFTEDIVSDNNYPQSRLTITLINNKGSFTNEKTWEVKDYDKDKIKIITSKLAKRDWITVVKQKAVISKSWKAYSIPDENSISIEINQLLSILENKDNILKDLNNLIEGK